MEGARPGPSTGAGPMFKVGGGPLVPLQEQQSGESEVLKNLRLAKEAYVSEMRHKDSRIDSLENQLFEASDKEKKLTEELVEMREQKGNAEVELRQTREEYSRVLQEKNQEISDLQEQIKDKEETIKECKSAISEKELEHQKMKNEHEIEINSLKEQLDSKTKKYNEDVRDLLDKKHSLELKVKDYQISEEKLNAELELARRQASDLRATLAEERLARKSEECSAKDAEIESLRRQVSMASISSGASLSSQNSSENPPKRGGSSD